MAHSAESQPTPSGDNCPICFSTLKDPHQPAVCSHVCCRSCLIQSLTCLPHCPVCRAKTQVDDIIPAGGATGVTVEHRTLTAVTRLAQPLPGLSRFSMLATGSVTGDVQNQMRMLQIATGRNMPNQSPAVTAAPRLRPSRFLHRRSLFSHRHSAPEDDLYTSVTSAPSPAPTTNAAITPFASRFAPAADTPMTIDQTSAPDAPTATPAPCYTLHPNLRHRLPTAFTTGSRFWDIGQHTPFPSPRRRTSPLSSVASPVASPVLADAFESLDDYMPFFLPDDVARVRTFVCPFCLYGDLDETELLDHCNDIHCHDNRPMVCPICVSLPHGDPNQISRNLIRHLNLRHSYDIEDYTNIHQNEMSNLQVAILESLRDVNRNTSDH